jgi:hypothetical protein
MGIRIGEFANERKDLVYETPLGDLHITYSPNALTPSDEAKLLTARQSSGIEMYQELLNQLCKLLRGWDMVGPLYNADNGELIVEEDQTVPLQPDILQHMPTSLMTGLFKAISEDNVPKSSTEHGKRTQKTSQANSGGIYQGSFGS